MLIEEFLNHVIAEWQTNSLEEAAWLDDELYLAQGVSAGGHVCQYPYIIHKSKMQSSDSTQDKVWNLAPAPPLVPSTDKQHIAIKCDCCGKLDHTKSLCWKQVLFPAPKKDKSVKTPKIQEEEEEVSVKPVDLLSSLDHGEKVNEELTSPILACDCVEEVTALPRDLGFNHYFRGLCVFYWLHHGSESP